MSSNEMDVFRACFPSTSATISLIANLSRKTQPQGTSSFDFRADLGAFLVGFCYRLNEPNIASSIRQS